MLERRKLGPVTVPLEGRVGCERGQVSPPTLYGPFQKLRGIAYAARCSMIAREIIVRLERGSLAFR